jgi:hypothetical protein
MKSIGIVPIAGGSGAATCAHTQSGISSATGSASAAARRPFGNDGIDTSWESGRIGAARTAACVVLLNERGRRGPVLPPGVFW